MARARRILVVDDDPSLRDTLGEVLADDGYEVRVAADGDHALHVLDDWLPDLIVLDIMMPVVDAYAFRAAQDKHGAGQVPVILVSAMPDPAKVAIDLQVAGVVTKPFRLDDFLSRVERVLE